MTLKIKCKAEASPTPTLDLLGAESRRRGKEDADMMVMCKNGEKEGIYGNILNLF